MVAVVEECVLSVSAGRLWKVAVANDTSILPKICPDLIAAVEVDGNGGPGSIKTMKLHPGVGQATVMKSRLLVQDATARLLKTEVLEAGKVREQLKSLVVETKLEPAGAGCVAKITVEYEKLDGSALSPEEEKKVSQGWLSLLKSTDAYLAAHPTEFA